MKTPIRTLEKVLVRRPVRGFRAPSASSEKIEETFWSDREMQVILSNSAPGFYQKLLQNRKKPKPGMVEKLRLFATRMTHRSTPYQLFAIVGVHDISGEMCSELVFDETLKEKRVSFVPSEVASKAKNREDLQRYIVNPTFRIRQKVAVLSFSGLEKGRGESMFRLDPKMIRLLQSWQDDLSLEAGISKISKDFAISRTSAMALWRYLIFNKLIVRFRIQVPTVAEIKKNTVRFKELEIETAAAKRNMQIFETERGSLACSSNLQRAQQSMKQFMSGLELCSGGKESDPLLTYVAQIFEASHDHGPLYLLDIPAISHRELKSSIWSEHEANDPLREYVRAASLQGQEKVQLTPEFFQSNSRQTPARFWRPKAKVWSSLVRMDEKFSSTTVDCITSRSASRLVGRFFQHDRDSLQMSREIQKLEMARETEGSPVVIAHHNTLLADHYLESHICEFDRVSINSPDITLYLPQKMTKSLRHYPMRNLAFVLDRRDRIRLMDVRTGEWVIPYLCHPVVPDLDFHSNILFSYAQHISSYWQNEMWVQRMFPDLALIPEISVGGVVFQRRKINLNPMTGTSHFQRIGDFLKAYRLEVPRACNLCIGDQKLRVDPWDPLAMKMVQKAQPHHVHVAVELQDIHEKSEIEVVSFFEDQEGESESVKAMVAIEASQARERIEILQARQNSKVQSFKIYFRLGNATSVLKSLKRIFGPQDRYVFLFYRDTQLHIRLRVFRSRKSTQAKLKDCLQSFVDQGMISRFSVGGYEPELSRWHGLAGLELFESLAATESAFRLKKMKLTAIETDIENTTVPNWIRLFSGSVDDEIRLLTSLIGLRQGKTLQPVFFRVQMNSTGEFSDELLGEISSATKKQLDHFLQALNWQDRLLWISNLIHISINRQFGLCSVENEMRWLKAYLTSLHKDKAKRG